MKLSIIKRSLLVLQITWVFPATAYSAQGSDFVIDELKYVLRHCSDENTHQNRANCYRRNIRALIGELQNGGGDRPTEPIRRTYVGRGTAGPWTWTFAQEYCRENPDVGGGMADHAFSTAESDTRSRCRSENNAQLCARAEVSFTPRVVRTGSQGLCEVDAYITVTVPGR